MRAAGWWVTRCHARFRHRLRRRAHSCVAIGVRHRLHIACASPVAADLGTDNRSGIGRRRVAATGGQGASYGRRGVRGGGGTCGLA